MTYIATGALILTVATLPVLGGVLLAPFLLGLAVLALTGVLAGRTDGSVERRETRLDPCAWRDCT